MKHPPYPPEYHRAAGLRASSWRDLPADLRPLSWDEEFTTAPDVSTSTDLIAAGESGIVPAETIFRLVDPDSLLHAIRAEIGDFAALRFWRGAREESARRWSGKSRPRRCQVFVPKKPKAPGARWIVHEIGTQNTARLCALLGGLEVSLPNGSDVHREEARRIVLAMHREGEGEAAIVAAVRPTYPRASRAWVRAVIRETRPNEGD